MTGDDFDPTRRAERFRRRRDGRYVRAMELDTSENPKDVCDRVAAAQHYTEDAGLSVGYLDDGSVVIDTDGGRLTARNGDLIVCHGDGPFVPCPPGRFHEDFEAAPVDLRSPT